MDAIITVTQAKDSFLKAEWIRPGTVVFPMGSYKEIEDEVILQSDAIVVDHVGQALHRGCLLYTSSMFIGLVFMLFFGIIEFIDNVKDAVRICKKGTNEEVKS